VSRRRRSYRIAPAPGSALPNQAGDESGDNIASTGQISRGGRKAPFFVVAFSRGGLPQIGSLRCAQYGAYTVIAPDTRAAGMIALYASFTQG